MTTRYVETRIYSKSSRITNVILRLDTTSYFRSVKEMSGVRFFYYGAIEPV